MKMKLYHGSPIIIDDVAFCSETYFTDDIEVAKQYGNFIYEIDIYKIKTSNTGKYLILQDKNTLNLWKYDL